MNIIEKCLNDLPYSVPMELLRIVFKDDTPNFRRAPVSIRELIMNKVIRPRFFVDCNIVGGENVIVSLDTLSPIYGDTYTIIYEIPKELTNFRTIVSVLSVSYLPYSSAYNTLGYGMGVINPTSMSDLMSATQRLSDASSNIPAVSNASADIVGENVIAIRDSLRVTNAYQLRCIIANEDNLANIQPRLYHIFSTAVVLLIKSYIYSKLCINIDRAYLEGGQEIGKVRELVDSYQDAEQLYQDYIKNNLQVAAVFNNTALSHERFIKLQINPSI